MNEKLKKPELNYSDNVDLNKRVKRMLYKLQSDASHEQPPVWLRSEIDMHRRRLNDIIRYLAKTTRGSESGDALNCIMFQNWLLDLRKVLKKLKADDEFRVKMINEAVSANGGTYKGITLKEANYNNIR